MICSTSTESVRMLNSAMVARFKSGKLMRFYAVCPARRKLRRFLQARAQNPDRSNQRTKARLPNLGPFISHVRVAVLVGDGGFPSAKQPTPGACQRLAHQRLRFQRIPETVVIH